MSRWLRVGVVVLASFVLPLAAHASTVSTHAVAAAKAPTPAQADPGPVDPDTLPKAGADALTTVRFLDAGKYQLAVVNTSNIGYIDTFNWAPPPGMTITAITSSEGGRCGLQAGNIHCSGKIAPPKCTCLPGGQLTVNFTATGLAPTFANGYWTYYGVEGSYLIIQTMTPVPYHIPSFLSTQNADLPLCKKGETSTKGKPCTTG